MKKIILGVVCIFGVISASETQQSVVKVFDATTKINGNNIYSYLNGNGLHRPDPNFPAIKVFEFNGKEYIYYGSLRELLNISPAREFSEEPLLKNYTDHHKTSKGKNSTKSGAKISANKTKEITQQARLDRLRNDRRRQVLDFARSNEAVYCEGVVEFFNPDGEYNRTGAIIIRTQKREHCEELAQRLHKEFCEKIKENIVPRIIRFSSE